MQCDDTRRRAARAEHEVTQHARVKMVLLCSLVLIDRQEREQPQGLLAVHGAAHDAEEAREDADQPAV